MESFTPISAAIGGALIGLSVVILMLFNGRIAGISGVFSGIVFAKSGDKFWRILFVLGLVSASIIYKVMSGQTPNFQLAANLPLVIIGGLLVGFGTRLGSGCTSGHGVCGLSRLSPRSLVSVLLFMSIGILTVTVVKTILGG